MKQKGKSRIQKQIIMILAVLTMVFVNIAGNMVYASPSYPDFKVTVTSKSDGGSIGLGSKINVKVDFQKIEGSGTTEPLSYPIYVREDYVKNSNATFVSQTIPDPNNGNAPVPIFVVSQSAISSQVPGHDGNYYKYNITYNHAAHAIDDNILKAALEMHIQLSEESSIIDIEEPILVETTDRFEVHKPEIIDVPIEFEVTKKVTKQFRFNSITNQYESISSDGFKPIQVDDVYEFAIIVKNINKNPVDINVREIKECLPAGYTYLDSVVFASQAISGSVKGYRNRWIKASKQDMTGYTIYENLDTYNSLSVNGTIEFYVYAKANITNVAELQNLVKMGNSTAVDGPPSISTGPKRYDMALTTYFAESYPAGKDREGNTIQTLNDANNAASANRVPVKYGHTFNASGTVPYVENGDILRLRTYYHNQSNVAVSNITVALYGLFGGSKPVYEIVDSNYKITDVKNTFTASGNNWENPNLSIKTLIVPVQVAAYSRGYFDILVRIKNYPKSNEYDRYLYAEIASFEDAVTKGIIVADSDSYNDCNPYNDMTGENKFKEKDNVISENAKEFNLKDEDDFDFAYVRSLADYELPPVVDLSKEISKTDGESIYKYSIANGHYVYSTKYNHLPSDNKLVDPDTYICYKIRVNTNGQQDLRNMELTDVLPKGLTFLTDDQGRYVYSLRVWSGVGAYSGKPFPINDSNFYLIDYYFTWNDFLTPNTGITVDCKNQTNTLKITADSLGHKMLDIFILAKVDTDNIDYNVSYVNSVVLKAIGITQKTEVSPSVEWDTSAAAAYIRKYMKVGDENNWSWIEAGKDAVQTLPPNAGDFLVDYRIKVTNLSTGGGFDKDSIDIKDNLREKVKSVSQIKMSGTSNGVELTSAEVENIFSANVTNNILQIKNDRAKIPAKNAEYYFDFTVTYQRINPGESVYNQLFGKSVYTVKPLSLEFIKTDMSGNLLQGAEFLLEYEDGTPVINIDGKPIQIRPKTNDNKAVFIPKDYQTRRQWDLVLRENKPPTGYKPRNYKLIVVKDAEGNLSIIRDNDDINYVIIESDRITLKNESQPSNPVDPTDPGGPNNPEDPTPTEPEKPTIPTQPDPPKTDPPKETTNPPVEEEDPLLELPDLPFPLGPVNPTDPTAPGDILEMLEDDRTPLGGIETGNEIAVGIEDEDIPLGSLLGDEIDDVPRTGENMMVYTSIILLIFTGLISFLGIRGEKVKHNKHRHTNKN